MHHEDRRVGQKLRRERRRQRHQRRPPRVDAAPPRVEKEHRRDERARQRHADERAEIRVDRQKLRVAGIGVLRMLERVQRRVRNRRQPRQRRRLVRVNVTAAKRNVAGVAGVRIDRKRVPFDDRARQIEGRVLVPAAAGEEVRIDGERQDCQPLRDSLVVLRNVEC